MAEVSHSTSQSTVLSGVQQKTPKSFDLHSWQGLTEVLKIARESELSDEAYAEFRDLVLQYAQSKGDSELKKQIDAYIDRFDVPSDDAKRVGAQEMEEHSTESETEKPKVAAEETVEAAREPEARTKKAGETEGSPGGFRATKRPAPRFRSSGRASAKGTAIKEKQETSVGGTCSVAAQASESKAAPESNKEKPLEEGKAKRSQFIPENLPVEPKTDGGEAVEAGAVRAEVDESSIADTQSAVPPDPKKKQQATPESQAAPTEPKREQAPTPDTTKSEEVQSIEDYKARITEIKRDVNKRVGNPITLIDSGNPIGRKYMTALLEAMKATAGGMAGTLSAKMQVLEDRYSEVVSYLEENQGVWEKKSPEPKAEETVAPQAPEVPGTEQQTPSAQAGGEKVQRQSEADGALESTERGASKQSAAPELTSKPTPEPTPNPSEGPVSQPGKAPASPVPQPSAVEKKEATRTPSAPAQRPEKKEEKRQIFKNMAADMSAPTPRPQTEAPKQAEAHTPTPEPASAPDAPTAEPPEPVKRASAAREAQDVPKTPTREQPNAARTPEPKPQSTDRPSEAPGAGQKEKAPAEQPPVSTDGRQTQNLASTFNEEGVEGGAKSSGAHPTYEKEIKNVSDMVDRVTAAQSEFTSTEVTEGLNQLLDEWSLFKNSGLLGMGPGGKEHPLYQQLSVLPMSELMAGRWEGVTRENLRILKDYINAWRNEQGITYTQNETFEHYLRRVVQRVLKRQNVST